MQLISDAKQLNSVGRDLPLPFDIEIGSDLLQCQQAFRLLPNKRLTCLATWQGKLVAAKLFFHPKHWIRHAQSDYAGAMLLEENDILTPKCVYAGKTSVFGVNVVLFEYIQGAVNFSELWELSDHKSELLEQIFTVLAQQHNAGIYHADLHLDNFLLQDEKLYTLDGDQVKSLGKSLTQKPSLENLGELFAHITPQYDAMILEQFATYVESRDWQLSDDLQQSLIKAIQKGRAIHHKSCLRKIFRDCTAIASRKTWRRHKYWQRNLDQALIGDLINNPDHYFVKPYMKNGNTCSIIKTDLADYSLVVKRYNIKNILHGLKRSLRKTRAAVSWKNAHRLQWLDINTPKPIALIEKRWGFIRRQAYYISQYIEGATLNDFILKCDEPEKIKQIADLITTAFARLYQGGLSHGDLKASNLLISQQQVYLLDLDSMRKHKCTHSLKRVWRRDINRFLRNFTEQPAVKEIFLEVLKHKELYQ